MTSCRGRSSVTRSRHAAGAIPPPRLEAKPAAVDTAKANPEAEEFVNTTNAKPKAKERVNTTKKPRSADRHRHPNRDRHKPG